MEFSDEILMRYADGELDEAARRAVEAAMSSDPALAERVARHHALRSQLSAAFDGVLQEPVPDRLRAAASAASAPKVADLEAARAARQASPRRGWAWKEWTAIAASVLMGVFVGRTVLEAPESDFLATRGEQLFAAGALDEALSNQVGGERTQTGGVAITATFRAKTNEYCRTFDARTPEAIAGIACRAPQGWRIHMLTQSPAEASGGYRMAHSVLPAVVAQTVESMIAGAALDADEEAAARARGWREE